MYLFLFNRLLQLFCQCQAKIIKTKLEPLTFDQRDMELKSPWFLSHDQFVLSMCIRTVNCSNCNFFKISFRKISSQHLKSTGQFNPSTIKNWNCCFPHDQNLLTYWFTQCNPTKVYGVGMYALIWQYPMVETIKTKWKLI